MKVILKKTSEIKPYDKNPRLNQEAIDAVAKSIAEYGFLNPLTICPDGTLVRGHTRWEAAKKLNLSHVPVLIADNMTEDEIRAFRIADNKVAEGATWDYAALMEEIKDIQQENRGLSILGFERGYRAFGIEHAASKIAFDGRAVRQLLHFLSVNQETDFFHRFKFGQRLNDGVDHVGFRFGIGKRSDALSQIHPCNAARNIQINLGALGHDGTQSQPCRLHVVAGRGDHQRKGRLGDALLIFDALHHGHQIPVIVLIIDDGADRGGIG